MSKNTRTYLAHADRRLSLIEVGLRLFTERSYHEVGIDDVAKEAGISKGLLYHYFGSKHAFYAEVVQAALSELLQELSHDPHISEPENIKRGLIAWFEFVRVRGQAVLTVLHGGVGNDETVLKQLDEARDVVAQRIYAGLEIDRPIPPLRNMVRSWIGSVEAAARDWLEYQDQPIPELVDFLLGSFITQLTLIAQMNPSLRLRFDLNSILSVLAPLLLKRFMPSAS